MGIKIDMCILHILQGHVKTKNSGQANSGQSGRYAIMAPALPGCYAVVRELVQRDLPDLHKQKPPSRLHGKGAFVCSDERYYGIGEKGKVVVMSICIATRYINQQQTGI